MRKLFMCAVLAAFSSLLSAQDKGYLSGNFETNTNVYRDDVKTGAFALRVTTGPTII